jgi:hypothetical protein
VTASVRCSRPALSGASSTASIPRPHTLCAPFPIPFSPPHAPCCFNPCTLHREAVWVCTLCAAVSLPLGSAPSAAGLCTDPHGPRMARSMCSSAQRHCPCTLPHQPLYPTKLCPLGSLPSLLLSKPYSSPALWHSPHYTRLLLCRQAPHALLTRLCTHFSQQPCL